MRMHFVRRITRSLFTASLVFSFGSYLCELQSFCQQLGATVNGATATPIPGAGHDYIHLLSETVDPSTGQVSVRITLPIPQGRGLTIPFSIAYDSGSVHRLDAISGMQWLSESFGTSNSHGFPMDAQGGWSYSMLPILTDTGWTTTQGSGTTTVYNAITSDFTFFDTAGAGHNLGLAWEVQSGPGITNPPGGPIIGGTVTQGGDAQTGAYLFGSTNGPGQVLVQDLNGTTYRFLGSGGYPLAIEDRNGNEITNIRFAGSGFPLGYTDTAGRPSVSITGTGAPNTEDSITIGGLTYGIKWVNQSASYSVPSYLVDCLRVNVTKTSAI
jgi:hypothetical protein